MYRVMIRVNCKGWATGGYENTLYFESKRQIADFRNAKPYVDIISVEKVSDHEFAQDYIGSL